MSRESLGTQVTGPVIKLATKVKAQLEDNPTALIVKTDYGSFYVSKVELTYFGGGDSEIVGYLVPDEAEGDTFDFYLPKEEEEDDD